MAISWYFGEDQKKCPVCNRQTLTVNKDGIKCTSCKIFNKKTPLVGHVILWAKGRQWWWRLLIVLYFAWLLEQNLHNYYYPIDRTANFFNAFDLGIHELGHILFSPFGDFMHILGGCLFQCLFPILWLFGFLQVRYYFAASMCFCWLSLNLFDVATYAGDARSRLLPLDTFGTDYDKAHDWYQILSRIHHLYWDHAIAFILRVCAITSMAMGFALGLLIIYAIFLQRHKAKKAIS